MTENPPSDEDTDEVVLTPLRQRFEVAWPSALILGCLGNYLGLRSGVWGLGALLSSVGWLAVVAPVRHVALGTQRPWLCVGWSVGVLASILGVHLDGDLPALSSAIPGVRFLRGHLDSRWAGDWTDMALDCALPSLAVLATWLAARWTRGWGGFLLVAVYTTSLGSVALGAGSAELARGPWLGQRGSPLDWIADGVALVAGLAAFERSSVESDAHARAPFRRVAWVALTFGCAARVYLAWRSRSA